jgi:plastocyanin
LNYSLQNLYQIRKVALVTVVVLISFIVMSPSSFLQVSAQTSSNLPGRSLLDGNFQAPLAEEEEQQQQSSSSQLLNTVAIVITISQGSAIRQTSQFFLPESAQIPNGSPVVWQNQDITQHTATADDNSFDTGPITSGNTSSPIYFSGEGQVGYHCNIHPYMTGVLQIGTNLTQPLISPGTLPPNQGTLPTNPTQMPFEQPTTDIPNTITIIIPQGAATQQLVKYYVPSPGFVWTGQQIIWNNQDVTTHTAVADDGSFNTGEIQPGSNSSALVIQSYGEYAYHCVIHPHMTGFLEVLPTPRETTSSQTIELNHTAKQNLLEFQHLRLAAQVRLQQMQAIAASLNPEQRLVQLASVEQNTNNSINVLKDLFSMQPEQQVLRLQELLLQTQQPGSSQLQGQMPTTTQIPQTQLIQAAMALDPERRDRQFLITLGKDRDFLAFANCTTRSAGPGNREIP